MKKILIVAAILGGLALLAVLGIVGLGVLFVMSAEDLPVEAADRELVLTASDLVPFFEDFAPDAVYESFEKLRYMDDSEDLSYEFDSPVEDEPYISVTITWEPSRSDANMTYDLEWSASILGMNIADSTIDIEEDSSFYTAGDRSRFGTMVYDGDHVGHMFVAQKGNTVYAYMISGFLLEDPDLWHEMLDDRIAGLSDL